MDLEDINEALGEINELPTPIEFKKLLTDAEVSLFRMEPKVSPDLLKSAWYLHAIAATKNSIEIYGIARQRRAYELSAHILDLAAQQPETSLEEKLSYTLGSQIGYVRSGLNPNATAVYKHLNIRFQSTLVADKDLAAVELAIQFLAMDVKNLFPKLKLLRQEIGSLTHRNIDSATTRPDKAAAYHLIEGLYQLVVYLMYGGNHRLTEATAAFSRAMNTDSRHGSIMTRWAAANLLDISDDLGKSSVWSVFPPDLPRGTARAMTAGSPPVLALWPPQLQLLKQSPSPLLLSTKRLVLSFPTSGGKTLLAQAFVLTHLGQSSKSVCFVVPTNSLAREVKASLKERLRLLNRSAEYIDSSLLFTSGRRQGVDVVTPEKLAFMLRNSPEEVLSHYSLFIFDEAHIIGDEGRGWIAEQTITLLHALTKNTEHRIILMSAMMGNRVHIKQWLDPDNEAEPFHSDWRGPRRIYAIYTSDADWNAAITEPRGARQIETIPLKGRVRLRVGGDVAAVADLVLRENVGSLVRDADTHQRIPNASTPFYKQLVPFIKAVAKSGPILIIEATKAQAAYLATALAEAIPEENEETGALAEFVSVRLGVEHRLVAALRKGVAFHHAALPSDVQTAIEDAVRSGSLKYIIATTVLAEGVNLPVRSVLIASQGSHIAGGDFQQFITGPKLLNAIGRAGRAGKESEGWIILAVNRRYAPADFDGLMDADDSTIQINSQLTSQAALEALDLYDQIIARGEDAILEASSRTINDFISFVWFAASTIEELRRPLEFENVKEILSHLLAFQQLDEPKKQKWLSIAQGAYTRFKDSPPEQRRRWAKSGMTLKSLSSLEEISEEVFEACFWQADISKLESALAVLCEEGRLRKIMNLPEAPRLTIRATQNSQSNLNLDIEAILGDWIGGSDLHELAGKYFSEIRRSDFRYEQLSMFTTGWFEHYLPWIVATVIEWVNKKLEDSGEETRLSTDLADYIRYGVKNPSALSLMRGGISSRRLANRISDDFAENGGELSLEDWLVSMDLSEWRTRFDAGSFELRELREHIGTEVLLGPIIADGIATIEDTLEPAANKTLIYFKEIDNDPAPQRIGIWEIDGEYLGVAPGSHQAELSSLLDAGIPYTAAREANTISIALEDPDS